MRPTADTKANALRCAVYTRKSSDEGLEQDFNSLDAQREAGESFIASQRAEGWRCLATRYDDGGFTGGNMERPALRQLMADIEAGLIDCVVVYKVDRLSRSLLDFARMMEVFEQHGVSFVSVTQQFNTTHSMGRLTLNILLSFAQFEREIISERTRDKIAAARRKGKWSGGRSVLGYDVDPVTKKLVVNRAEAELVREVFRMYLGKRSLMDVVRELNGRGLRTKSVQTRKGVVYGGREWDKPAVLKILGNILYRGRVRYKAETFPGEHEAIVDEALWTKVHEMLRSNGRAGGMLLRNKYGALLKGLVHCGPCGLTMGHTTSVKDGSRVYRYYVCYKAQKQGWHTCPTKSVPAGEIERFVLDEIRCIADDPALMEETVRQARAHSESEIDRFEREREIIARELKQVSAEVREVVKAGDQSPHMTARLADLQDRTRAAERRITAIDDERALLRRQLVSEEEVRTAFGRFDDLWAMLNTRERTRMMQLLIDRIDYDGAVGELVITFHPSGIKGLVHHQMEGAA